MLGLGNLLTKSGVIKKFPNDFSFNFDGSNDYLEAGESSALGTGTNFSISFWFKSEATSKAYMTQIQKGVGSSGLAILANALGTGVNAGYVTALVWNGSTHAHLSFDGSIDDGEWHHIAFTTTSSAQVLYFDGQSVDTDTIAFTNAFDSNPVVIGARGGSAEHFDGLIDEFAIWDTVLSSDDVVKIYKKPVDLSKPSKYATDRTGNLKLWLRAGDKVLPENDTAIARQDFYTDFDGTDDYVDCGSDSSVDDIWTGGGTITGWINSHSIGENTGFYVVKRGSDSGWHISNKDESGDTCKLRFAVRWDNFGQWTTTSRDITYNEWIHIAVSYDNGSTSNNPTIYINGVSVDVTTVTAPSGTYESDASDTLYIGGEAGDFTTDGAISNIALHQTILDAQTISQMAKSRFTPMRDNRFSVVDFDGSNDFINISSSLTPSALTFTTWIATVADSSYRTFIQCGDLLISQSNGNKVHVNKSGVAGQNSTTSFVANEWTHIAITADSSGTKVYRNGVLDLDGSAIAFTAGDILIGKYSGGQFTSGSISSVAYYSSVKSVEEVYALYSKGITYNESSESGLVGYWRMGDDTSKAYPTIADSSSNSNDGTITNGASDDIVQQMVAGYDLGAFESSSEELGGEIASDNFGGWTLNGWTDNGDGTASANNSSGGNQDLTIYYSFTEFIIYKMTATFSNISGTFYYNLDATGSLNKTITTNGEHILYVQAPSGGSGHFFIRSSNGSSATISNVSIKEVLQSEVSDTYPAIIDVANPILGVELVDTDAQTFEGTSTYGWAVYGSNTIANDSNTLKITREDHNQGAYLYLRDSTAFSTDLTVGSIYKMTADFLTTDSSLDYQVRVNGGGGSGDDVTYSGLTNTSFVTKSFIFKANHTQNAFLVVEDLSGSQVVKVDNMSLREIEGNVGTMTNQDSADLVYSSVLPDQSFLTGVNSAYNFISLDGSNEYIDAGTGIGNFLGDNYAGDLSISVWFKSAGFGNDGVFNIGNFSSTNGEILILIYNNELGFHLNNAGWRVKVTSFSDTSWNHLVCVYKSGSESDTNMYLNGSSVGSKSGTFPSASDIDLNGLKTIIGAYSSASTPFNGDMGQVAIWNKELSSTEVSAIYTAGRHSNLLDSYSDNLKGYWAMSALDAKTGLSDVGDGTIYDRSGNSNHGTATNTESADLKSSPNAEPEGYAKGDTNRSTTTP